MASGAQQLRLLLWKDYLLRKRKPITIGGVIWAAVALLSLVIVRKNVDPEPKPTCEFSARALPSAGVGPFLQSFLCTLSNECDPLDRYQEIPDYRHTRLKQYQEQFLPLFEDADIQEVLHALPGMGRLLATLTRSIDVPELHQIVKNGLKVSNLFKDSEEVKNILQKEIKIERRPVESLIESYISLENVIQQISSSKNLSCDAEILKEFFITNNEEDVYLVINKLCSMDNKDLLRILKPMVFEIDFGHYIKLVGEVLNKMTGSDALTNLASMLEAVSRLSAIENYVPRELQLNKWLPSIILEAREIQFKGFSYVNIELLYRLLDLFEPTFKDTKMFKYLYNSVDVLSGAFNSLQSFLDKEVPDTNSSSVQSVASAVKSLLQEESHSEGRNLTKDLRQLSKKVDLFTKTVKSVLRDDSMNEDGSLKGVAFLSQLILDNLPKKNWYSMSYYLTLMNKLVLGGLESAKVHLSIESIMYRALQRNPTGVELIGKLGPDVVAKLLDALASAERIQAVKGKVFHPGQLFCDSYRMQTLLSMSKPAVAAIKPHICNSAWKNFAIDVISSFGVHNASKTINDMASMVVSDTLGKSVESEFIKVVDLMENLKVLVQYIRQRLSEPKLVSYDWDGLFQNVSNYKDIKKVFQAKTNSSNIILVTVHTMLAREVISENRILDTYLSPVIDKASSVLQALSHQLSIVPRDLMEGIQEHWPRLYRMVLSLMKDKQMALKMIYDKDIVFCTLGERENATEIYSPEEVETLEMLCRISAAISAKLNSNPADDKLIQAIKSLLKHKKGSDSELDWKQLTMTMQQLYTRVQSLFGFLFAMEPEHAAQLRGSLRLLEEEVRQTELFNGNPAAGVQLSAGVFARVLDILDGRIFGLNEFPPWNKIKTKTTYLTAFLREMNLFTQMLTAFMNHDESFSIQELPTISLHLRHLALNFAPLLRDVTSFIAVKDINIEPIILAFNSSPAWPCDEIGLGPALSLSPNAQEALKGAEALMCASEEVKQEWNSSHFLNWVEDIKSNTTLEFDSSEKIFYKASGQFIQFIDNMKAFDSTITAVYVQNNSSNSMDSREFNIQAAWEDAIKIVAENNQDFFLVRRFFKNLDVVMNFSNKTDSLNSSLSPSRMWEAAFTCSSESKNDSGKDCRPMFWTAVKYTVKCSAEAGSQIVRDLTEYFTEISEPDANALQLIGFTKRTGPYILYSKLPDFIDILFNSFLDQGFMKQITRAAGRKFWDCERLIDSMVLPSSGHVTSKDMQAIRPYICPSFVHWVSMPVDENVLLDIFGKSQYIFFNKPVSNYTANFTDFFEKSLNLKQIMDKVPLNDTRSKYTLWDSKWVDRFQDIGKTLIANDTTKNITKYDLINSKYMNDGLNMIYLNKITTIIYKMSLTLKNNNQTGEHLQDTKEQKDLSNFLKLLNRRPGDAVKMFIFAITEFLLNIEDYHTFDLNDSFDFICKNETLLNKGNMWINMNLRIAQQVCKMDYRSYINDLKPKFDSDLNTNKIIEDFVELLVQISDIYKSEDDGMYINWKDVFKSFLKLDSGNAGKQLKLSITYARELELESFLVYQSSRLQYYSVALELVLGKDWWGALKQQGPENILMDVLENSSTIVDDLLTNMAKLKVVRLVKDIKLNDTKLLCDINLSDYIPDKTGLLSALKKNLCQFNQSAVYMEVPPLRLAAKIYEDEFKIVEEINITSIMNDVQDVSSKLVSLMENGTKPTQLPRWITKEDLDDYNTMDLRMNEEPTKVDIAFLFLNNIIDAATLFVNSTYSPISSSLTPWVKQVNLQLIKSGEYTTLICELPSMSQEEIHAALLENFHWDLALSEVVSRRNYTWIELNKSLNQLSDIARHYTHDSLLGKMDRVTECLLNSSDDQPISKAAMYISLGSRVMQLIHAMIPHFKEINRFENNPTIKKLRESIKNSLKVNVPIERLVSNKTMFNKEIKSMIGRLNDELFGYILDLKTNINENLSIAASGIDFAVFKNQTNVNKSLNSTEKEIVTKVFLNHLDKEFIAKNLETLRDVEFWSLRWLTGLVSGVEGFLWNGGQILQLLSPLPWDGIRQGEPLPILDLFLYFMHKDFVDSVVFRVNNIIKEIQPLVADLNIEEDLIRLSKGLSSITTFRKEIISSFNLKFEISKLFRDWDELKADLKNETMFSDVFLNELQFATLNFEAVLNPEADFIHVEDYVCERSLSKLLQFSSPNLTLEQASSELCHLNSPQVKEMAVTLLQKINFTYIIDKVINATQKMIIKSSSLTEEEGTKVIQALGKTASLIPTFRGLLSNILQVLGKEPLLRSFQQVGGITDLLANSDFLADAGNMVCGKPFYPSVNRFYKAIMELKDNNEGAEEEQLESLATDYCRDLHKEVVKMGGGKILWSYAKPLLLGKILYTPNTPETREIITHANSSFSQVGQLTSLLRELSQTFVSLEEILQHRASLDTMQHLIKSEFVQEAFKKIPSSGNGQKLEVNLTDINLNEILTQFGDVDKMKTMVSKLSQMTDCISLDRFVPVESEELLEQKAAKLMVLNEFLAGVVFLNGNKTMDKKMASSVEYKIRMDIDNVPSTSRIKNQFWSPGPDADFIDNLRYFRGFIQLQDLIDKAIIDTRKLPRHSVGRRDTARADDVKRNSSPIKDWAVYTQQMAYPCWVKDDFQTTMYESQALIVAFFFCLILTVSSIVRSIVWERESGNTDLMCVMGMRRRWHSLSWFVASLVEMLLTAGALCAVLKWGSIVPNTDTFLLLVLLLNFGFSIVMFCYMVSSLFESASLGAVSAAILYLLSFMPYIIIIAMEAQLSLLQKMFASISMSSGFSYGLLQMARFEVQGTGLQWNNMWDSPQANDSMNVALSCIMVLIDSLLYALIGWIINSLRFRDNIKTGIIGNVTDKSNEEVGVRIEGLGKVYQKGGTQALSGVSIDLAKGHITTLLGHNGAGKTTLIKILTGIIKPSTGKITINQQDIDSVTTEDSKGRVRSHIGLCPQFDVLLEVLSAREHLSYYAQLKTGESATSVKQEVDSMLDALGLGPLSVEPVHRLSGGLRRRLCVGLAFIAHPHLVILDEPSSGVDPVARRDIWSLILGLKDQRTILLTTHHLDEAEILSDTVIIMHKGRIQATGSPISLKHQYGEGYKLTIAYPLSHQPFLTSQAILNKSSESSKRNSTLGVDVIPKQEENSVIEMNSNVKELMKIVMTVVGNSKVTDVKRHQVEINLPFLDENGLNNDLLSLTQVLEDKQSELSFSSMLVDSSNLEQVFLGLCGTSQKEDSVKTVNPLTSGNGDAQHWDVEDCSSSDSSDHTESYHDKDRWLWPAQLLALLHKRMLHYVRNPRLLTAALLLPTLFVAIAMGFSLIRPPPDSHQSMQLANTVYGQHSAEFASFHQNPFSTIHTEPGEEVIKKVIQISKDTGNRTLQILVENDRKCECVEGWQSCADDVEVFTNGTQPHEQLAILPSMRDIVDWIVNTHDKYIEKRYGGWSLAPSGTEPAANESRFVVWYNNKGQHSLPAYLNTLSNAILSQRLGSSSINITTYSHPLKLSAEQISKSTLLQHVADVGISVVLLIGFSLVPSVSAVFLVGERTSQQKRLQLLSAVHPLTYWTATLLWDIVIILVAILLSVIVFWIFSLPVYVSRDNMPAICFLLLLYGFSSSCLVHLLEKLFGEPSLANMVIFCGNVFMSVIGLTILLIIDVVTSSDLMQYVRRVLHKIFLVWPGFSLGDGLVLISRNSIQADVLARFGLDTYLPPLSWDVIGPHCVALVSTTVIFFLLNVAIEMKFFDRLTDIFYKNSSPPTDYEDEDCDVVTERYRVELATMKSHYNLGCQSNGKENPRDGAAVEYGVKELDQDVLQVLGLTREYRGVLGSRVAVNNVTFGVKKGQCFGLLGVNGAGKSTTFSMLTGELRPTKGRIYLQGKVVSQSQLCDGSISYCPQNDALDPLLTLTEHLVFYCRIRGLNKSRKRIKYVLEELDMNRYSGQRANTLSGGNRRKLCLAIALLSDSPLLLLDEPTSGMDPGARQHAGQALMRAARQGRALLLSSHSLPECEALCSRSCLLWAGCTLALGPPAHLKQRFGGGHLVRLVGSGATLWVAAEAKWSGVRLLALHPHSVQLLLPPMQLSNIFRGVAEIATQVQLTDFSINQTSLDQVFINFSNSQENEASTGAKLSPGIRLSTLERQYNQPKQTDATSENGSLPKLNQATASRFSQPKSSEAALLQDKSVVTKF